MVSHLLVDYQNYSFTLSLSLSFSLSSRSNATNAFYSKKPRIHLQPEEKFLSNLAKLMNTSVEMLMQFYIAQAWGHEIDTQIEFENHIHQQMEFIEPTSEGDYDDDDGDDEE